MSAMSSLAMAKRKGRVEHWPQYLIGKLALVHPGGIARDRVHVEGDRGALGAERPAGEIGDDLLDGIRGEAGLLVGDRRRQLGETQIGRFLRPIGIGGEHVAGVQWASGREREQRPRRRW